MYKRDTTYKLTRIKKFTLSTYKTTFSPYKKHTTFPAISDDATEQLIIQVSEFIINELQGYTYENLLLLVAEKEEDDKSITLQINCFSHQTSLGGGFK